MEEFGVVLSLLLRGNHALAFSSLSHWPIFICAGLSKAGYRIAPAQTSGGHHQGCGPAPEWLLCGKSLSSQHSKQSHLKGLGIALSSWQEHAKQQAWAASTILGNYSPWWPKTLRSLEPPFKAGAQPGLCHCQITEWQQTINYSCKPAWVQIAEAAPGVRLHEEVWCVLVGGSS